MSDRPGPSSRARVRVLDATGDEPRDVRRRDDVATEEPLEIRVTAGAERRTAAVTMRTPGHDFELAAGFLAGEGVLSDVHDLHRVDYCTDIADADQQFNIVTVALAAARLPAMDALDRHGFVSSACGVCGKDSLDALAVRSPSVTSDLSLDAEVLFGLPDRLRDAQGVFTRTGGLHAAGLFTAAGEALVVREDVGRHNAVDKAIGSRLLAGQSAGDVLVVSGRTSFEILQKAVAARIPVVAGVSAPSSLAVDTAERFGITLGGFLRGRRVNLYAHADRIGAGVRV